MQGNPRRTSDFSGEAVRVKAQKVYSFVVKRLKKQRDPNNLMRSEIERMRS